MSSSERQHPGVTAAPPRPRDAEGLPSPPSRDGALLSWEEFFRCASADQQEELLSLAERQGLLYYHQLPTPANGILTTRPCRLLEQLFAGNTHDLAPLRSAPIEIIDTQLDAVQREAVAKAVQTPDICLIQGLPGSGKSRVITEIILQAAQRGERVLLLAKNTAAVDQILHAVAHHEKVFSVRCLEERESLDTLDPTIRPLAFDERVRALRAWVIRVGQREAETREGRYQRIRRDETTWKQLEELAGHFQRLEDRIHSIETQQEQVPSAVEREVRTGLAANLPPSPGLALAACAADRLEACGRAQAAQADVQAKIVDCRQRLSECSAQLESLRRLVDSKSRRQWWTAAWWRAVFQRGLQSQWSQLEGQHRQSQEELERLTFESNSLLQVREQADQKFQQERRRLLDAEIDRRQAELDVPKHALLQEKNLLESKWQSLCRSLAPDCSRPLAVSTTALQAARDDWSRLCKQAEEQSAFARQWLAHVSGSADFLTARLPLYVNLVTATVTALALDPRFGDNAASSSRLPLAFDVLVLEEADQFTEPEFLKLAQRARRWVLVGEPKWEHSSSSARSAGTALIASRAGGADGVQNPGAPTSGLSALHCLWNCLHCDARQLPYGWSQEGDRICCRLRPVAARQRQWLEIERVADFPDIELRILALPRSRPELAEVLFPPGMPIDQAKQYIFRELQELAIAPVGRTLSWVEEGNRLLLLLGDHQIQLQMSVQIEQGVSEGLGMVPCLNNGDSSQHTDWQTCYLEFDRRAGWDRQKAEDWIQKYSGLRDFGRTSYLDRLHRMRSGLATFIHSCLTVNGSDSTTNAPRETSDKTGSNGFPLPIEFVPVPPLTKMGDREVGQGDRIILADPLSSSRRGGAGLELDMTDARHRERLPAELRADLPKQGFVNYTEAQAIIRALSVFATDTAALAGIRDPHARHQEQPRIAVFATYPAQAELIRRLLQRVASGANSKLHLEVGVPQAFLHREVDVALVSLTRSHTHRAVSFSDSPEALALALTRARSRLVLFGDAGTLIRRAQWDGPLDHLDESAARRERALIAQIVRYIQAHGLHSPSSGSRQGSG